MSVEIDGFKTTTDTEITTKTAARSITPLIVGNRFKSLADIVEGFRVTYVSLAGTAQTAANNAQAAADAINVILGPEAGDADTAVNKLREALVILQSFSEGADVAGLISAKVTSVAGKSLLSDSEIARLLSLGNYTHPTTDGNLHVLATSTTNNGKVLSAGATAGSLAWVDRVLGLLAGYVKATAVVAITPGMSILEALQILEKGIQKTYTLSEYNVLSAASQKIPGVIIDLASALVAGGAVVVKAGWFIIESDTATLPKVANGATAISALTYGIETDLATKFGDGIEQYDSGGGVIKLRVRDDILAYKFVQKRFRGWFWKTDSNLIDCINLEQPAGGTTGTDQLAVFDGATYIGRLPRQQKYSATTVGSVLHHRIARKVYCIKSGFRFKFITAVIDNTAVPGHGAFYGFTASSVMLPATTEPSVNLNIMGVAKDSADVNLQLMTNNGAGVANKINLGANFPASTALATSYILEMELFIKPDGTALEYNIVRRAIDTGLVVGTSVVGTVSTKLPALTEGLAFQVWRSNMAVAAEIKSMYSTLTVEQGGF